MDTTNSAEVDSFYDEVGNLFFNDSKLHDVEFIVGEQKEKIKAVRLQLINQSRTWWSMLSKDSHLAEQGEIKLPDIDPEVFHLVLKHSYGGLESLQSLSDDIVMKLCYCANKYFMASLMKKIATRLEPKGVKDLFPALHCLVYYNLQGVEEAVKTIVQNQTTKILVHPEFLECDIDSVTYICKQEVLHCDELTLWKAVVKWAKHKAQGGERAQLRKWMSQPLQHIRITTLSLQDLRDYVFTFDVLSDEEIISICKGDVSGLLTLCNVKDIRCFEKTVDIICMKTDKYVYTSSTFYSSYLIGTQSIMINSIVCRSYFSDNSKLFDSTMTCVDIQIELMERIEISNYMKDPKEEPVTLKVSNIQHYVGHRFTIPTLINGVGITLEANSLYRVKLDFSKGISCWVSPDCAQGHDFGHGKYYCSWDYSEYGNGKTYGHIVEFTYQVPNE